MEITGSASWARALSLQRAAAAARALVSWRAAALVLLLTGLYLFVSLFTMKTPVGIYTSPDETAHYLITRNFGETGKLYYTRDYALTDNAHLLRPRAIWHYHDRFVLPNSQGLPFTYGLGYRFFGDNVVYLALLLAPLTLFFLYETASLLIGRRSVFLAIAFFGAGPLLYWFSHPYWNSLGATAFFAGGLYFLVRYWQESRPSQLVWCGLFFSLSMLFRYEYPVFVAPLVGVTLYFKHARERWRLFARDCAVFGVATVLFFLVPVVAFSEHVYDKPLVFPTAFQRDSAQAGSFGFGFLGTIAGLSFKALVPQGFDPLFVGKNLVRFTIMLVPAFTLLAAAGFALALRRGVLERRFVIAGGALLLYYIFFVGSVDSTNSATGISPTYEASIVRYWLLVYVMMFFLAGYLFVTLPDLLRERWSSLRPALAWAPSLALGVALAASTMPMVWFSWSGSLDLQRRAERFGEIYVDQLQVTESNAIIYSIPSIHKYTAAQRDVAFAEGLPEPRASLDRPFKMTYEEAFSVDFMADHMTENTRYAPIYLIDGHIDFLSLLQALRARGYVLEQVGYQLDRLEPDDPSVAYSWRIPIAGNAALVYAIPTERNDATGADGAPAWATSLVEGILNSDEPFVPKYVSGAGFDVLTLGESLQAHGLALQPVPDGLFKVVQSGSAHGSSLP